MRMCAGVPSGSSSAVIGHVVLLEKGAEWPPHLGRLVRRRAAAGRGPLPHESSHRRQATSPGHPFDRRRARRRSRPSRRACHELPPIPRRGLVVGRSPCPSDRDRRADRRAGRFARIGRPSRTAALSTSWPSPDRGPICRPLRQRQDTESGDLGTQADRLANWRMLQELAGPR